MAAESIGAGRLMTIDEVAQYTQLSKYTLYKMRAQGQGPRAARLGKHLRYRWGDVEAWISAQLDEQTPTPQRHGRR